MLDQRLPEESDARRRTARGVGTALVARMEWAGPGEGLGRESSNKSFKSFCQDRIGGYLLPLARFDKPSLPSNYIYIY